VCVLRGQAVPKIVDSGTRLVTKDNVELFSAGLYGN
jgi:hypothetical protein